MIRRALIAGTVALALGSASQALATPSTNMWAPSTPAIQSFGVMHLTYDTYFQPKGAYPVDVGLEIGALPSKKFQAEVGFDLFYPTYSAGEEVSAPMGLNAKVGSPEGALFEGSPGWSAGIFGVGFEEDVTDYNILHAMVGKTFGAGTFSVGGYHGLNENLFLSSDGEENQSGYMAGWFSPAFDVPLIDHINLTWDIQSGENVFGATGAGLYLYFTPTIDVLMGPVFFFDKDLQPGGSDWMWSVQLDVDLDLRKQSSAP